ncbi:MAG: CPBP family intramembrane metalloprotease [Planctomycetaceae bacterium]|nr:MAG: CPBP family intramembrane metalloprotease [Planctomycetaceae bacterium]
MNQSSSGRLWRLCRKELRETLRDRRTILTLVIMPLLLYPLLSMTLQRFLLSTKLDGETVYRIAVASEAEGAWVRGLLDDPLSQPPSAVREASEGSPARFEIFSHEVLTPEQTLEQGFVDVAAIISLDVVPDEAPQVELLAKSGDAASQAARRILVERLQWLKLAVAEQRLAQTQRGPPDRFPRLSLRSLDTAGGGSLLATVVPLVLVLMTITGAVYPAIDLTAGERERGTIEALIASPVSRGQVLFAKYTAVVTVALLTAIVNLVAMLITLQAGGLLPLLTGGDPGVPWFALLQILGLLVLFSGFFSAVLLCLTSFAKSFKEAQAYLIPLMLLALAPGVLSLLPGVELTTGLAVVPLVNIILLARELLAGGVDPVAAVAAVVSTVAYAAAALGIAARLFGSDAILRGSEVSAGSLLRRPLRFSDAPTPATAALVLAMIFPIYFWVSNTLAQLSRSDDGAPIELSGPLLAGAVSLTFVFGGIPLVAAWFARDRLVTTFRLRSPLSGSRFVAALIGAAVMGLGLWGLAHESFVLTTSQLDPEKLTAARQLMERLSDVPLWLVLIPLAVAPGVIEELCFRGYLFSAFSRVLSPLRTILLTSLLFGLFHVLTGNTLLIERFVPTTLMGLFLGWVAYRTGSVWPGMVLHTVHNGFLNTLGRYRDHFAFLGSAEDELAHLPATWLLTTALIAALGGLIIAWASRPSATVAPEGTDSTVLA